MSDIQHRAEKATAEILCIMQDAHCPACQREDIAKLLRTAFYDVQLDVIEDLRSNT